MKLPAVVSAAPIIEQLENRWLLSAPSFTADPYDKLYENYTIGTTPLAIGVDGFDADGDAVTVTVTSSSDKLTATAVSNNPYAVLHFVSGDAAHTPIGDIVVQLYQDIASSLSAVQRFITLSTDHVNPNGTIAASGDPFYTDVLVHRVIPNFMIQTGDALNGDGSGDSPLPDLIDPNPMNSGLSFAGSGVLAMANKGASTSSSNSQFFITDAPYTSGNSAYIIFGQVISGRGVLEQIISLPTTGDRPDTPPIMAGVDVFTPEVYNQDGVIHLSAAAGFTGEANVTVTITDSHGNSAEKVIRVHTEDDTDTDAGNAPTIPTISDIVMPATGTRTSTVSVNVVDDKGADMTFSFRSPVEGVTGSYDQATKLLTVTAPDTYDGMLKVIMSARESGWADRTPTEKTFYVITQSDGAPKVEGPRLATTGTDVASQVVGNRLYQISRSVGLRIYDVTDPASPSLLGTLSLAANSTVQDIAVVGNTAFITAQTGGLISVNVEDPAHPVVRTTMAGSTTKSMRGLTIVGDYAYVAEYTNGMSVYKISDPAVITLVGRAAKVGTTSGGAVDVVVDGQYAYLSDSRGAIFVYDITLTADQDHVTTLKLINYRLTDGLSGGMVLKGDTLYVAQNNGLAAWDASRPTALRRISTLKLSSGSDEVAISNQIAVVNTSTGFDFVDLADPARMSVVYHFKTLSTTGKPSITGNLLALPMDSFQTVLLDVEDMVHRMIVHRSVTFLDDNQVPVTVTASGGEVYVYTSAEGSGKIERIVVPSGTGKTSVTIKTPAGTTTNLYAVEVQGSMATFTAGTAQLHGEFDVVGTMKSLTLGSSVAGSTLDVGAPVGTQANALTLSLGKVTDLNITSGTFISSLTAINWIDSDATSDITAPGIGSLKVTGAGTGNNAVLGDFQADVRIAGGVGRTTGLGPVTIAHDLAGSTIDVLSGNIGAFKVTNVAGHSTIRTDGNIASFTAGAADGLDLLAGISDLAVRRAAAGQFENATATIGSFSITGWRVAAGQQPPTFFADSNISAAVVKAVKLKNVDYDNGGEVFGVWTKRPAPGARLATNVTDTETALVGTTLVTTNLTWPSGALSVPISDFNIQLL